jgi:hypothetical protein
MPMDSESAARLMRWRRGRCTVSIESCWRNMRRVERRLVHRRSTAIATEQQIGVRLAILRFCRRSNYHDWILLRTIPPIVNLRLNLLLRKNSCI